jgi:hypothetical protein
VLNERQFGAIHAETSQPGTGATVDPHSGRFRHQGWAAAVPGHERVVPTHEYSPGSLASYTQEHQGALSQPGHHLGIWHEPGEGAYLDVSKVRPETYRGGVETLAGAYHGAAGLEGRKEKSVYRMGTGQTLYTAPDTEAKRTETAGAMETLAKQRPKKAKPIAEMSTKKLAKALRNRR